TSRRRTVYSASGRATAPYSRTSARSRRSTPPLPDARRPVGQRGLAGGPLRPGAGHRQQRPARRPDQLLAPLPTGRDTARVVRGPWRTLEQGRTPTRRVGGKELVGAAGLEPATSTV